MNKGIIFDLDGTLWDSSEQVVHAWNVVLARRPETDLQITVSDMHSYMGRTMEAIAELMMPEIESSTRLEIMLECTAEEEEYLKTHSGNLFPNVEETLKKLSTEYKLFIVSNCQDGYIQTFLACNPQLEKYFSDFECPGRTGKGKGENIRLVYERNSLEKAIYVGDTQGDCDSSDFAGVPFIHAAYGFGKINREVPKINNFEDLVNVAEKYMN